MHAWGTLSLMKVEDLSQVTQRGSGRAGILHPSDSRACISLSAHYPMKRTQPIHLASLTLAWALAEMWVRGGVWCQERISRMHPSPVFTIAVDSHPFQHCLHHCSGVLCSSINWQVHTILHWCSQDKGEWRPADSPMKPLVQDNMRNSDS